MNAAGGDVLLVIGDSATSDGDALEQCLSRFHFSGPKLLVAGNHELWSHGPDSHQIFTQELPRRARRWAGTGSKDEPFVRGGLAVVGSVGWYDYSFAPPGAGIPRRFYEHKISPGAAGRLSEFAHLLEPADDIAPSAREVVARWNDGKFVKLGRSDEAFLQERLDGLESQLNELASASQVIAAVHHLPFGELLPPLRRAMGFRQGIPGQRPYRRVTAAFPQRPARLLRPQPFPRRSAYRSDPCRQRRQRVQAETFSPGGRLS